MATFLLKQEQNTFEKKGWKGMVVFTLIVKILVGIISIVFVASNFKDDINKLSKFLKK